MNKKNPTPTKETKKKPVAKKVTAAKKTTPTRRAKPVPEKAKVGAPTKYQPAYAEQARKLCLLGYTDVQLADFFEVSESSIHKWKHDFPEFSESIKKGKDVADAEVAASLYQRALGYSHDAVKIIASQGVIYREDYIEHYPPDATSAIFWLKNRQSKSWRDKVETAIEHSYTTETLQQLAEIGEKTRARSQQMMEEKVHGRRPTE